MRNDVQGLTQAQRFFKRSFDISFSVLGLFVSGFFVLIAIILARLNTGKSGIYKQKRIGRHGKVFTVLKIRTMRDCGQPTTDITVEDDPRITGLGLFLRKFKIDELPQLWNVLIGEMSFVGPRPDVPGFADMLKGENRLVLSVRPGITGPASLKYRNESVILLDSKNPEHFNKSVIYPDKVKINLQYIEEYSFSKDIFILLKTLKSVF